MSDFAYDMAAQQALNVAESYDSGEPGSPVDVDQFDWQQEGEEGYYGISRHPPKRSLSRSNR